MTILGISASGRKDGITSEIVNAMLEATGEEYEFIPLAGKKIGGYIGCTRCAADNRCKVMDDWPAIEDHHLPPRFAEQERLALRAYKVGKTLGSILRARRA